MLEEYVETRIIKASKVLQAKVGSGLLDPEKVRQSQQVIERNMVDFAPLGLQFLDELSDVINKPRDVNDRELRELITQPIMQLKANAAMFKYNMVGKLANIMLSFMESIQSIDHDTLTIVAAHEKTLRAILLKRMSGSGGAHGQAFEAELKQACRRYFLKRNIAPAGIFLQ